MVEKAIILTEPSRVVRKKTVSLAQAQSLGYDSLDNYLANWGELYSCRIWYIDIKQVTAASQPNQVIH